MGRAEIRVGGRGPHAERIALADFHRKETILQARSEDGCNDSIRVPFEDIKLGTALRVQRIFEGKLLRLVEAGNQYIGAAGLVGEGAGSFEPPCIAQAVEIGIVLPKHFSTKFRRSP